MVGEEEAEDEVEEEPDELSVEVIERDEVDDNDDEELEEKDGVDEVAWELGTDEELTEDDEAIWFGLLELSATCCCCCSMGLVGLIIGELRFEEHFDEVDDVDEELPSCA